MNIEKILPSCCWPGAWRVTELIGAQLVRRVYYGHTKRDALRFARLEFKELRKAARGAL